MITQSRETQDRADKQNGPMPPMIHKIEDIAGLIRGMRKEAMPLRDKAVEREAGPAGGNVQPEGTWITTYLLVHHCLPAGL